MAPTQHEIDSYSLFHMVDTFPLSAIIQCSGGGSSKGSLYFYKEGTTIPVSYRSGSGTLILNFRENQLTDVLATLRQEKPLYIWFDDSGSTLAGGLIASHEPIGEAEPLRWNILG